MFALTPFKWYLAIAFTNLPGLLTESTKVPVKLIISKKGPFPFKTESAPALHHFRLYRNKQNLSKPSRSLYAPDCMITQNVNNGNQNEKKLMPIIKAIKIQPRHALRLGFTHSC